MGRSVDSSSGGRRGAGGGTLSAWVLMVLSVQVSISALAWGGPGSADTRMRLATAMVAAGHRGIYCEPFRRQESVYGHRVERCGVEEAATCSAPCHRAGLAWAIEGGWASALPPPTF